MIARTRLNVTLLRTGLLNTYFNFLGQLFPLCLYVPFYTKSLHVKNNYSLQKKTIFKEYYYSMLPFIYAVIS